MKNAIVLVAILFGFLASAHAQTPSAAPPADAWKDIKLGPMFMPGVSANAGTVASGTKTDAVDFSWAAGAVADFPFSPNLGAQLTLAYDNRTVGFHDQGTGDTAITYTFSYFSIRPELRVGDFLVGVGIGIPVGASTSPSSDATALNKQQSLGASGMNVLFEGRIGAAIPVLQMDNGSELRFLLEASYAFSQITPNPLLPNDNNISNKAVNNGPLAGLQLGFAYLFDLTPH